MTRTILVVDDQWGRQDDPMFPCRYGNVEGYRFELEDACAGDGRHSAGKVVERLSYGHADGVLLDMDFGMNQQGYGEKILEELRTVFPELPIFIFSSTEDSELIKRCMEKGAVGRIPKAPSAEGMKKHLDDYFGGTK